MPLADLPVNVGIARHKKERHQNRTVPDCDHVLPVKLLCDREIGHKEDVDELEGHQGEEDRVEKFYEKGPEARKWLQEN